ncbi:MAG: hypothetical protein IJM44_03455 [Ruminococcus sp.]|nr:hypothetical protein [Ruminococcus sp.]
MTEKQLTRQQLAAMLLMTDAFALFCLRGGLSAVTAAAFAAGCGVQFVLALPFVVTVRRGRELPRAAMWTVLAFVVLWGGGLFRMLWDTAELIFTVPGNSGAISGRMLTSGLIAAVCVYAASEGRQALARASVIAAALGAVCLAVVAVSAATGSDWHGLTLAHSERGFLGDFTECFAMSGGVSTLILLLPGTKGEPFADTGAYFAAKGVISAVVILTAALVTGGIMPLVTCPVITAAQLSQPFQTQRIDALFLMIFAIFAVFALAVQTVAAAGALGRLIPQFRRLRSAAVTAAMLGAAFLPISHEIRAVGTAVLLLMPAAVLVTDRIGGRK